MLFSILFSLLFVARSVSGSAYVGCMDPDDIPSGTSMTATDISTCISQCESASYAYAFYVSETAACECASSSGSTFEAAEDSEGTCTSDQAIAYKTSTTFEFQQCSGSVITVGATWTSFTTSVDACFSNCADYVTATFARVSDTQYYCLCAAGATPQDSSACGASESASVYIYTHSADAAASGLARRSLRERLRQVKQQANTFCPASLSACIVGGDSSAFECVDTEADLESCGGCVSGRYGTSRSRPTGTDCSALPGVAMGGVTCLRGSCQVSACKSGYTLIENVCVRL